MMAARRRRHPGIRVQQRMVVAALGDPRSTTDGGSDARGSAFDRWRHGGGDGRGSAFNSGSMAAAMPGDRIRQRTTVAAAAPGDPGLGSASDGSVCRSAGGAAFPFCRRTGEDTVLSVINGKWEGA
nr:unnamed protein product [Digitaria exilis]